MDGNRRTRELWRFACEGYLGKLTREYEEQIAGAGGEARDEHDGEPIRYRMLTPTIANTADRDERAQLERIRNDLTEEHLNPLYLEAVARDPARRPRARRGRRTSSSTATASGTTSRGSPSSAAPCSTRPSASTRTRSTGSSASASASALAEAERYDIRTPVPRPAWDPAFPADRMLPALGGTLADLGIDLDAQENVHLDVEERPTKTPRAFCAPIEIPDKVMLVIQPQGGPDDWRALFHEAGHTEHFAFTVADLSVEERRLGDNAVTEGWAMLLEHLTDDPAWLTRRLDFPRPESSRRRARSGSSTSSAATARSSSTSSSSTPPTTRRRCAAATSSSSATR